MFKTFFDFKTKLHVDPPTCRTGYSDMATWLDTSCFFKLVPKRISVFDTIRQNDRSRMEKKMCIMGIQFSIEILSLCMDITRYNAFL